MFGTETRSITATSVVRRPAADNESEGIVLQESAGVCRNCNPTQKRFSQKSVYTSCFVPCPLRYDTHPMHLSSPTEPNCTTARTTKWANTHFPEKQQPWRRAQTELSWTLKQIFRKVLTLLGIPVSVIYQDRRPALLRPHQSIWPYQSRTHTL